MRMARGVDAFALPQLPVERAMYERVVRTQDLSGCPEADAADIGARMVGRRRTRGGRLPSDDCEMLVDVINEPIPTEWTAKRGSDSGAAQLTGRHSSGVFY